MNAFRFHLLADQKKGAMEYWRILDRIIQEIVLQQDGATNPDVKPVDLHVKYIVERYVVFVMFTMESHQPLCLIRILNNDPTARNLLLTKGRFFISKLFLISTFANIMQRIYL